jgi:prepilin-type N-terminal cleavage/methylation domain-containing protein
VNVNDNQRGFSILELMIALGVMLIIMASVVTLMKGGMRVSNTTFELTDAQESLRTAQEYINRDLVVAGDGLRSVPKVRVPSGFVTNYLTLTPVTDVNDPGIIPLAILTSDDNVPASTAVRNTSPAVTVRSTPNVTDRMTMLALDRTFNPIALLSSATAVNTSNVTISIAAADLSKFTVGEIYFITSELGGAFGTITSITAASGATPPKLVFASGDTYGLNNMSSTGPLKAVSAGGTLPTSLMRMQIIHYFINSNGLLIRREFGVIGAGFTDSIVAEHVTNLQFRYVLDLTDAGGFVMQPVRRLANSDQQDAVRQVEVTCSAETVHFVNTQNVNGSQAATRQEITMTTSTSVRNIQFREALQPTADDPSVQ